MTPSVRQQEIALRRLFESGWISAELHDAILRAAKHAADPAHLLEFVIAVGHLERKGVHVVDAIEMIVETGGNMNLLWSARRWRQEHDRLGRMLAAKRLNRQVGADVPFATEWLENALPPRTDPRHRLITILDTPRTLAGEGLRQGHCIANASYVERFRRGDLLGVSVLTKNGNRWTVTINRPAGGARPSVHAIYGRFNATPDWQARQDIRDTLGPGIVDRPPQRVTSEPAAAPYRRIDELRWLRHPRLY